MNKVCWQMPAAPGLRNLVQTNDLLETIPLPIHEYKRHDLTMTMSDLVLLFDLVLTFMTWCCHVTCSCCAVDYDI